MQLQSRLDKHILPEFGSMRAADITSAHIERYKRGRARKGVAPATINRELEIIRRAFRLAALLGGVYYATYGRQHGNDGWTFWPGQPRDFTFGRGYFESEDCKYPRGGDFPKSASVMIHCDKARIGPFDLK